MMATPDYSTLVAKRAGRRAKTLSQKAKASAEKVEAARLAGLGQFGSAMSSVVNQAFVPASLAAKATANMAGARVAEAMAAVTASQQSNVLNDQVAPAMRAGQRGVLARVRQAAEPSLISARTAMQEAKAYADRIGIEMKTMDWQAKSAVFQSILDTQAQARSQQEAFAQSMVMAQFQSNLQLDQQKAMYKLTLKQQEDAEMAGASQVVNALNNTVPSIVGSLPEIAAFLTPDDAVKWAQTNVMGETQQAIVAQAAWAVHQQSGSFTEDGILDITERNAVMAAITSTVSTLYPSYAATPEFSDALGAAILTPMVAGAVPQEATKTYGEYLAHRSGSENWGILAPVAAAWDRWIEPPA